MKTTSSGRKQAEGPRLEWHLDLLRRVYERLREGLVLYVRLKAETQKDKRDVGAQASRHGVGATRNEWVSNLWLL